MHYSKQKFDSFITNSRSILNISAEANNSLREVIGNYGYTDDRLAQGAQLYDELVEIAQQQIKKEEVKRHCFDEKAKFQTRLAAENMKFLKIARIVFNKDEEAFSVLKLKGARERTYKKWYYQVSVFCNNLLANPEYLEKMSSFGVNKNAVEILKSDLDELQGLTEECTRITASVGRLVKEKRIRMVRWQEWLSDYLKIVRIAVQGSSAENSDWLKQLLSQGE